MTWVNSAIKLKSGPRLVAESWWMVGQVGLTITSRFYFVCQLIAQSIKTNISDI